MSHVRQQIREAAAAALVGQTDAQNNVTDSYVFNPFDAELPLIDVRTDSEESEYGQLGGNLDRVLTLSIRATVQDEERSLDGTLDDYAAAIEARIGGNTFSSLAKQTVLAATEVERSAEGNRPTGSITLTFQVLYMTSETDGETAL